jgi:hypothetical protein
MADLARPHPRWPGLLAGLLAALLFFAFAALPFLFVWGWSGAHCEPKPDCQDFAGRRSIKVAEAEADRVEAGA